MSIGSSEGSSNVLDQYRYTRDLSWATPVSVKDESVVRDLFRGCIVWGAVGDALGRPAETHPPAALRARFGPDGIRDYVPWHGWQGGPRGTFTDDTQLTVATAESLIHARGTLDPDDLVHRFLDIGHIRGCGRATARAISQLRSGTSWWDAGKEDNSAGNGAAMRAAPIGLVHTLDSTPAGLIRDAVLSAVPTHPHPVGVAGTVAIAAGVAWCARARLAGIASLDVAAFVDFVCAAIGDLEPGPTQERKPDGREVTLLERLRELPNLLLWSSTDDVFAYTYNGAFALESVPAALYTFLRSPGDPRQIILTAINAGYDADTVASMAGNLAGAWCGVGALKQCGSWWTDLEDREKLLTLADRLTSVTLSHESEQVAPAQTSSPIRVNRRTPDHFTGCLVGGAVGDALGAPVEFLSLAVIRERFGPDGIGNYVTAYGKQGAVTDDTQMTLFTAEGLIRADNRGREKGICHPPTVVYHAYLRWLETQGGPVQYPFPEVRSGWLIDVPELHSPRAPGNTCLQALRSGRQGSIEQRLNDSKGCGGVMRVAPVGLAGYEPFKLGCDVAALTHGHPSGFLAAGFFASMIAAIVDGQSLTDSIAAATVELEGYPGHQECLTAVDRAVTLSRAGSPSAEQVESLGAGWVAEEALAIGLYCALVADGDFEQGMRLAVNHGGDSDSTGSLTGQLLGALLGLAAIPERWRAIVEIRVVVEQVAIDLYEHFGRQGGVRDDAADWRKYPGW